VGGRERGREGGKEKWPISPPKPKTQTPPMPVLLTQAIGLPSRTLDFSTVFSVSVLFSQSFYFDVVLVFPCGVRRDLSCL